MDVNCEIKWCTLKHTKGEKPQMKNIKQNKKLIRLWLEMLALQWKLLLFFVFLFNMYILIRNNDKDYRRQRNEFFYFILFYSVVLLLQMILCYNEHYNLRLLTCFAVAFCCCCCYCCLSLYKYILHIHYTYSSFYTMNFTQILSFMLYELSSNMFHIYYILYLLFCKNV